MSIQPFFSVDPPEAAFSLPSPKQHHSHAVPARKLCKCFARARTIPRTSHRRGQ